MLSRRRLMMMLGQEKWDNYIWNDGMYLNVNTFNVTPSPTQSYCEPIPFTIGKTHIVEGVTECTWVIFSYKEDGSKEKKWSGDLTNLNFINTFGGTHIQFNVLTKEKSTFRFIEE